MLLRMSANKEGLNSAQSASSYPVSADDSQTYGAQHDHCCHTQSKFLRTRGPLDQFNCSEVRCSLTRKPTKAIEKYKLDLKNWQPKKYNWIKSWNTDNNQEVAGRGDCKNDNSRGNIRDNTYNNQEVARASPDCHMMTMTITMRVKMTMTMKLTTIRRWQGSPQMSQSQVCKVGGAVGRHIHTTKTTTTTTTRTGYKH